MPLMVEKRASGTMASPWPPITSERMSLTEKPVSLARKEAMRVLSSTPESPKTRWRGQPVRRQAA